VTEIAPGRWPPAYDADQLADQIRALVADQGLASRFYDPPKQRTDLCQGDVVQLDARLPFLDEHRAPRAEAEATRFWIVLGNTCDLDRSFGDVPWTGVAPIRELGPAAGLAPNERDALARYQTSRRFYLPSWGAPVEGEALVASFLEIATVDRRAVQPNAVVARMSYAGWILFHSCLIRYLAREDRRNDV
jgi:hypothetical protein